ncbi:hypothetical protein EsH8_I_000578 [Colletotrichum jinshuiense]
MPSGRKFLSRLGIRLRSRDPSPQPDVAPSSPLTQGPQPVATLETHNPAFDMAISSFFQEITEEERQAFISANSGITADDLYTHIAQVDKQDKHTMARKRLDTISRFLRLLNQLVNGVSIGIQASPEISSLVVGGAKLIIDMAVNFVSFFEKLTIMIQRLSDHLDHLEEFSKQKNNELIIKSTANVYGGLLQFYRHAYAVFKGPEGRNRKHLHLKTGIQAQWKPFEEVFGNINSDIQHHLSVLEHSASAATFSAVTSLKKRGEEELAARERKELLQWLSDVDFDGVQASVLRKRWPGTGSWLLDHDHFKSWLQDASGPPLLWCNGGPGTGKSVLSSVVVDHLQQQLPSHAPGSILVYAYFSYRDHEGEQTDAAVASLTKQLIRSNEKVPATVVRTFRDHSSQDRKPVLEIITEMFCEVAKQAPEVFVVIDALDECHETDRDRFLGQFVSQVLQNVKAARLLITSRPEMSISDYLCSLSALEIKIGAKDTREDIKSYVRGQLDASTKPMTGFNGMVQRKLRVQDPQLRNRIVEVLEDLSDGMFLWVDLQLNQIFRQRNEDDIIEVLTSLPKSLNDTYIRILQQTERESRPLLALVVKCLMWVIHSRTRLRLYELRDAIVTDESITDIVQLQRSRNRYTMADIIDTCRGLLVSEDEWNRNHLSGWAFVRPVHFSLVEFIMTDASIAQANFAVLQDMEAVECNLAQVCVSHLTHVCLAAGPASTFDELRIRLAGKNTPFAWYCARFFDEHAAMAEETQNLKEALDNLLAQEGSALTALAQLRHMRKPNRSQDFILFNSEVNSRTIIETSRLMEIESVREDSRWKALAVHPDSLHQACAYGQADQVKYLLGLGLNPSSPNNSGKTPFAIAIQRQRLDVVNVLLRAGTDINQIVYENLTALEYCSGTGHDALVKLLLDTGAVGIEHDCTFTSALFNAVWSGGETIARLLLSRGAVSTDEILRSAAESGMIEVVEASLRFGISPDGIAYEKPEPEPESDKRRRFRRFSNELPDYRPLYCASKWGWTEAVRVLLEYNADACLVGGSLGTPLQAAALGGRLDIVKLLLKNGAAASINHGVGTYGTALSAAAYNGQNSVVQVLLDAGADVNSPGGEHGYALVASVQIDDTGLFSRTASPDFLMSMQRGLGTGPEMRINRGRHNSTKKLISAGADVASQGPAALTAAAERGHIKLVKLLISYGAQFDSQALSETVETSTADIVNLMLQHGADPNGLDKKGRSPLVMAVENGKLDIVKALIAGGANTNLPSSGGDSFGENKTRALHEACTRADLPIVRTLLDNHADPNLLGTFHWSSKGRVGYGSGPAQGPALHAACADGSFSHHPDDWDSLSQAKPEVVSLLLKKGAKVDELAEDGWTALELACSWSSDNRSAYKIARVLIDAGVDINASGGQHSGGALEAAARHGSRDIVELLLSQGIADERIRQNALQVAADERHEAIVDVLINNGVDVTVPHGSSTFVRENDKPIHSAARNGTYDIAKKLIDAGANLNEQGYYGVLYKQ